MPLDPPSPVVHAVELSSVELSCVAINGPLLPLIPLKCFLGEVGSTADRVKTPIWERKVWETRSRCFLPRLYVVKQRSFVDLHVHVDTKALVYTVLTLCEINGEKT